MSFVAETPATQHEEVPAITPDSSNPVPPLISLYFYLADACNLACRHCWIEPTYVPNGNSGKYIKLEHVEKAICEAKPLGLASVKLTGGEPTLHPQFREIVALAKAQGVRVIIETNGTLVDADMAKFLREQDVDFISISLDGAKPTTHDSLRSVQGSYEKAINGIKALVEQEFSVQIICTLHRGNITEIEELIALGEQLGVGSVKFNHIQQIGRGERFITDYGLDITQLLALHQRMENEIIPQSKVEVFFDVPFAFYSLRRLFVHQGRCTIQNILGVLSTGELSICGIGTQIPELVFGHIDRDSIRDIWYNSAGLQLLRTQVPDQLEGICGECIHANLCQGSCVAHNYHRSGKLNASFSFCERAAELGLFPSTRKQT